MHQVRSIAIGISEANPLVEIGDCSFPLHSTPIFMYPIQTRYNTGIFFVWPGTETQGFQIAVFPNTYRSTTHGVSRDQRSF